MPGGTPSGIAARRRCAGSGPKRRATAATATSRGPSIPSAAGCATPNGCACARSRWAPRDELSLRPLAQRGLRRAPARAGRVGLALGEAHLAAARCAHRPRGGRVTWLDLRLDAIPPALRELGWIGWRAELEDGEWKKRPYQVGWPGRLAANNDPEHWRNEGDVREVLALAPDLFDGFGVALVADARLVFIDLDGVRDP